jgi:hypothetical protein
MPLVGQPVLSLVLLVEGLRDLLPFTVYPCVVACQVDRPAPRFRGLISANGLVLDLSEPLLGVVHDFHQVLDLLF